MSLREFLATLRDICLFRRGPEDLPYSPPLLVALLVGCGVLLVAFSLHNGSAPRIVVAMLAGGLAIVGAVYLVMRVHDKPARFVQTLTALALVYLLFGVVAELLVWGLPVRELSEQVFRHPRNPPQLTGIQSLLIFGFAALGIWQLCVFVGILRRALETSRVGALLMLLLFFLANWFVASLAAMLVGAV